MANRALGGGNTPKLMSVVFSGLYTLRNQLIHGGATWNGQVNREQVRLGGQIMGDIVPAVLSIMMRHPKVLWGSPSYPVVD